MYMLNMVIILIIMYCNVVTAIDKIPTYLLRFNKDISQVYVTEIVTVKLTAGSEELSAVISTISHASAQSKQTQAAKSQRAVATWHCY